jgi:hypothetical protein
MRRVIVSLCFLLTITSSSNAQDNKTKANTLTPKEIADGWILLFDGETTFGFTATDRGPLEERAVVNRGVLQVTGGVYSLISPGRFHAYELSFEFYEFSGANAPGASVSLANFGTGLTRHKKFSEKNSRWTLAYIRVADAKATTSFGPPGGQPDFTYMINCNGTSAIAWGVGGGAKLSLRNIKLKPLSTKSLFNGKDLTGWRDFPGKKSKFTVTDKGEFNAQDGPGDLQTVGKYQNFILQLECISNGKHLNSGIFFRCRDNEYQNGYEAQIRNQFTPEATQKYVIENYDPMTNKLLGKKDIMSTAVDYGTGAIYRRQPARKEMAKDGEWFAMTIVADGNHLATWVNGVQVTDWFDNRPRSDNARIGCKLDAGHISIQGHDPTTNLSFRNLRIAELPAAK